MILATCQHESRKKHGKDRKGNQRWKCCLCNATITCAEHRRPLGDMRIDLDDACKVLSLLLEGMSIRACERLTGINRDTICDLIVHAGENCQRFLQENVKNVAAEVIEMDEIWDFVAMKHRTKERKGYISEDGDSWTWLAIDAKSKLVLTHAVGLRNEPTYDRFMRQLIGAVSGNCQITSDGLTLYRSVPFYFGTRCSFAQLTKTYSASQTETRYSPATIIGAEKVVRFGKPDKDKISTSYSERLNLSLRMHIRRYTRLTNAHSKSHRHHAAMTSLFVAWYNYCRYNSACGKKTTPAMAAGLVASVWTIKELLQGAV
jgi:transposase-like protein/IS1 family transposase